MTSLSARDRPWNRCRPRGRGPGGPRGGLPGLGGPALAGRERLRLVPPQRRWGPGAVPGGGRGNDVPDASTADSVAWLARPGSWDDNGGDGAFSDKRLARIQFARSLAGAVEAGAVSDRSALDRAADRLAEDQEPDGSWPLDGPDTLGSPATYGWSLATLAARDVLRAAGPDRHPRPHRPGRPLAPISADPDGDGRLGRAAPSRPVRPARSRRSATESRFELLRRSQSADGGWGPFETSPPEAFDTALAVLALAGESGDDAREMARRGRSFLLATQLPGGGWVETTRPSGNESLAQHTSTTAWATLAPARDAGSGDEAIECEPRSGRPGPGRRPARRGWGPPSSARGRRRGVSRACG